MANKNFELYLALDEGYSVKLSKYGLSITKPGNEEASIPLDCCKDGKKISKLIEKISLSEDNEDKLRSKLLALIKEYAICPKSP